MSATTEVRVLVVAKAPVPGRVKTRLAVTVGDDAAARLAAAALADTLDAAVAAVGAARCVLALDGDLMADDVVDGEALSQRLEGWRVVPQGTGELGSRLARAHADCGPGPIVQVGMDTPHAGPGDLLAAAAGLDESDAVLGHAPDGGWWVLAVRDASAAAALAQVPMSTPTTGIDTEAALAAAGLRVGTAAQLGDVDDAEDAAVVAALAPQTRFARVWQDLHRSAR